MNKFREKSPEENKYTSTGIKFWRHRGAMDSYKHGEPETIISTHISPEGRCNLSCSYCSVSRRKINERIELSTIKNYVLTLKKFGLKAVILTGGGEPTLYPQFNEPITWLAEQNLSVALITNGTNINRVKPELWKIFSWVRVSLNFFAGWKESIRFPEINGVLGASMVYIGQSVDAIKDLAAFVPASVKYIRVLPNCLHEQEKILREHERIEKVLRAVDDKRFFRQFKIHEVPRAAICHQAYFKPVLERSKRRNGFSVWQLGFERSAGAFQRAIFNLRGGWCGKVFAARNITAQIILTIPPAFGMIEHLKISPEEKILDFGCAKGYPVKTFRLFHVEEPRITSWNKYFSVI